MRKFKNDAALQSLHVLLFVHPFLFVKRQRVISGIFGQLLAAKVVRGCSPNILGSTTTQKLSQKTKPSWLLGKLVRKCCQYYHGML